MPETGDSRGKPFGPDRVLLVAREKTAINVDIWGDADFRNLTAQAQSLYFKLMSHPKLDYCGVVEFHPGRLAALSRTSQPGRSRR
jgi:hypothetical protein